jgi:hypothetical protein
MSDRRFGFRQIPDSRDHCYTMPPVLAAGPEDKRVIVDWEIGIIRDQGVEGACVGFCCRALLDASPFRQTAGPSAREIYLEARIIDEFDDRKVPEGTSVRAGLNVLKSHGLIQSYVWATGIEDVYQFIARKGPVVLGVNWYSYNTTSEGQIPMTGTPVGGHCVLLYGFDRTKRHFLVQNSWGESYGKKGRGFILERDLARELSRGAVAAGVLEKS